MRAFITGQCRSPSLRNALAKFHPLRRQCLSSSPIPPLTKSQSRITKITARLPKSLQRYTRPLLNAPVTHIASFLILHELTAIIPLFCLAAVFQYTQWLPPFTEYRLFREYQEKFGNYLKRKGYLGAHETRKRYKWFGRGDKGLQIGIS